MSGVMPWLFIAAFLAVYAAAWKIGKWLGERR